jgi:hypothetical protein
MIQPRTKSQNGRRSRTKGAVFEREVSDRMRAFFPHAERNISQSRKAAREGCDVEKTPFWIECKVGSKPDVWGAIRQARRDAKMAQDSRPCVVIAKRDNEGTHAVVPMRLFETMCAVIYIAVSGDEAKFKVCIDAANKTLVTDAQGNEHLVLALPEAS